MNWSVRTGEKINELFKDNDIIRKKLLAHDANAIRQLGIYGNSGFSNEEILEYIEDGLVDKLYEMAKKRQEIRDLYYELIGEPTPKKVLKMKEKN